LNFSLLFPTRTGCLVSGLTHLEGSEIGASAQLKVMKEGKFRLIPAIRHMSHYRRLRVFFFFMEKLNSFEIHQLKGKLLTQII
jgi:hypothetical protein